jgi:hypothetical protein
MTDVPFAPYSFSGRNGAQRRAVALIAAITRDDIQTATALLQDVDPDANDWGTTALALASYAATFLTDLHPDPDEREQMLRDHLLALATEQDLA